MEVTKIESVQHINILVDEEDINKGALNILKVIRPNWDQNQIQFKLLTDGITNKLVGCKPKDGTETETVLVRIYGNKTDLLIDRKAETRNIILLNGAGLAPDLYATFQNGLAYRFVPGATLSDKTVIEPKIYHLVAKQMAKLHKLQFGDSKPQACLWDKLAKFLDLVPDVFSDANKQIRFKETVIPKSQIQDEINILRNVLVQLNNPIVFAHNDLLLGNVIYTESENCVTFIDYEYAAFNYQAYDIGNHFAEFVGLDEVDYEKFPKKELQLDWLSTYLRELNNANPTEEEVEDLYVQVNQFVLASHIFWGIWALIQTEHSYIDFDFLGYAAIRFNEYFARKDEFLSLR